MQTTEMLTPRTKMDQQSNLVEDKSKAIFRELGHQKRSNYDVEIPRKLMEAICGTSTNTLVKLENNGLLKPRRVLKGQMDYVIYGIEDVHTVFKHKGISFKTKEEAEIISIFSQKGGVGKSAFTQHFASTLSLMGRVLVVDLDAQADATVLFGLNADNGKLLEEEAELDPSIAELMDWTLQDGSYGPYNRLHFDEVVKTVSPTLDVIPADLDLGEINYSLNRMPIKSRSTESGREIPGQILMIKEVFEQVKHRYDYVIIDCPPNIETCNVSALFASDRVLIPLELEAKSLTTMRRNVQFLEKLNQLNSGFKWEKVLAVPNKQRAHDTIKVKALSALQDIYLESDSIAELSQIVVPNANIIDKCADWKCPIFVPTTRFGTNSRNAIPVAQKFSNYFWAIAHELLDLPIDRLWFDPRTLGQEV